MRVIDIDKLLKTPLSTQPWEHQKIEGLFTTEAFEKIQTELVRLLPELRKQEKNHNGWWIFELQRLGMSDEVAELIMEANRQILSVSNEWIQLYSNPQKSKIGYFSIPRISYSAPGQGTEEMHHDAEKEDKTMIAVNYFYPKANRGTRLYTTSDTNSFHHETKFAENTGFIFAPEKNVTWHDVHANTEERIVLGLYYEPLERSHYINKYGEEKMIWFYEEMNKGRISTEI